LARNVVEFIQDRESAWVDLEQLLARAKGRVDRLDTDTVRLLGRRYREAVADLALARRRYPHEAVTIRLDRLVRTARPLVYGTVSERTSVWEFATTTYWRRVREKPLFLLIAALALFVPTIGIGLWSHANPDQARSVAQVSTLSSGLADGGAPRDPDTEKVTDVGMNSGFSAQIFTNNVRVALVAFAGGLTGGVLTLVSLVFNGLVLGLVGGLSIRGGYGNSLWRLVLPHGILELSLIVASGAAGLRVGWAILHPGHRTRMESLAIDGRAGLEIALGSAALLVPCGFVEGFVTPRGLSLPAALMVGSILGAAYWAMVLWRGAPAEPSLGPGSPSRSEPGGRLEAQVGGHAAAGQ